ncbi:MAG: hypothetical protein M0T78_04775 [Actinomycetota bacterium]|nr:hypothetical protein [Actinomycetota bacterium]
MALIGGAKMARWLISKVVIFSVLVLYFGPASRYPLDALKASATSIYVAVVIDFGDGPSTPSAPIAKCVAVAQGSSLLDALTQAVGASNVTFASSGLLCTIDSYPTPQVSTTCGEAVSGGYRYWSFWTSNAGKWSYAKLGAGSIPATTGAVEGWRFEYNGTGNPNDAAPTITPNFQAICPGIPLPTATTSSLPSPTTTSANSTSQPAASGVVSTTSTEASSTPSSSTPSSSSSTTSSNRAATTSSTLAVIPTTSTATPVRVAPSSSTTSSTVQAKSVKPKSGTVSAPPTNNPFVPAVIAVLLLGGGGFGYLRLKRR